MKILVIGGNGFLGSAIVKSLSSAGHQIFLIGRKTDKQSPHTFFRIDFFQEEVSTKLLESIQPDVVIQAAWITNKTDYRVSNQNIEYSNATRNILLNCLLTGVPHFIGIGSCAEYGNTNFNCNAATSPLLAHDRYAQEKIKTFNSLSKISANTASNFTWVRIFQPYGIGQDPSRFLPSLIRSSIYGEHLSIDQPNAISDWISKSDVGDAFNFIIENQILGAVDVGSGVGTSNIELVEVIASLTGKAPNIRINTLEAEPTGLVMDQLSPLKLLGWANSKTLKAGIEEILSYE